MKKAPIMDEEHERQDALNRFNILDTLPELSFDEITRIAAYVCDVPISLISLIDKDRQWFKSKVGLTANETPRDISFCGHAIYEDDIFIVENSLVDPRFKDNPLVTGDPNVIFYAGAPLKTKTGYNIGTLCVIDHKAKKLNERQIEILKDLSHQVIQQFEIRNINADIVDKNNKLEAFINQHSIIMGNMADGVVLQDRNYKIIDFNPAALKILCLSEQQLLGITSLDPSWKCLKEDETEFPGTEHPAVVCLNTNKPQRDIIMGVQTKDDKLKWINVTAIPIFNDKSKATATHTVCTFTDITEKRIFENRLKLCLSATSIGLWEWDVQKNILIWDDSLYRLYELKKNEFSGAYDAWLNSLHPDDKLRCDEIIQNSIAEAKDINFIFRIKTPYHKIKFIQTKAFLKLDQNKKSLKYYGVNLDITQEYESKINLEKLQFALENSAIVSFTSRKGDITYVNDNFCKISGYKREELIAQNNRILNSGFHSKEFFVDLWKTISLGHIWHEEICNKKKCGEIFWVDSYIVPLKDSSDKIEEFISIRYDITSRKETEQQLLYSSKMSSLGEMAGGIAHEINNPLSIISGRVDQIKRRMEKENIANKDDYLKKLSDINKTIERIIKIISGLRSFSRSSDNDPFEIVSLSYILEETLSLCQEKFKNYGVEVKISGNSNINLKCKHVQIKQVLINLFNNSFDAINLLENKWIEVNIKTDQQHGTARLDIVDSGKGIPTQILEKIMQPFFTTKEIGKGTGLGLSISQGIIEKHNGKMYYDKSAINTTFVIELPFSE